jgi:hypothetical protein
MSTYNPCENFYKYSRLEGRPRETELDDALAAKIHDPLWMLARQYQFGEFQGEDSGSAIFAKMALNTVPLAGYRSDGNKFMPVDNGLPLETTVERLNPGFDNKMALRMGKKFLNFFETQAGSLNKWPSDGYRDQMAKRFPFRLPEVSKSLEPGQLAAQIRQKTQADSMLFLRAIAGKALNGANLWEFIGEKPSKITVLVKKNSNPDGFVDPDHEQALIQATKDWIEWICKNWNIPPITNHSAWIPEKMEYGFDLAVNEQQDKATEFHADGYHQGHLDWFGFDVGVRMRNMIPGEPKSDIGFGRIARTMIPAQASFPGMPNSRWWELEDNYVDPGNIKANDTDVVAVLLAQFALLYSNDWHMIPCDVPVGSMVEVEGIVITDTFGHKTYVEAAHKDSGDNWKEWTMYSLASKPQGFNPKGIEQRIFIPPAAVKVLESDPVEQIKFIRDEIANMVWGIERYVPDGLGSGLDGYEAASAMTTQYLMLAEDKPPEIPVSRDIDTSVPDSYHQANTSGKRLKYTLGNTVTENWIPFIPVHMSGSNRSIQLRRASMPRINEVVPPHQVRPRTPLLRTEIDRDDKQISPFHICEEEVPRAGVIVTGSFQRTRWHNGSVVTWYGRKKTTGRGEGSSGLRFDYISDKT